mmetsp:Transcript_21208/g.24412  ORF Transcript_21208/g.24412 Transcript_21208/m.24412 type:complete len:264 (+) Transcript_21208:111-902(+)
MSSISDTALKAIQCPVCLETYDEQENRVPTTFPCGHSACMAHFPSLRRKCPSCRAPIPKYRSLRKSVSLSNAARAITSLVREYEDRESEVVHTIETGTQTQTPHSVPSLTQEPAHAQLKSPHLQDEIYTMGFDPVEISHALAASNGSIERAIEFLLADRKARHECDITAKLPPWLAFSEATSRACGHKCQLMYMKFCCECSDQRPVTDIYDDFIDGVGWSKTATRHAVYCPTCRDEAKCKENQTRKRHMCEEKKPTGDMKILP